MLGAIDPFNLLLLSLSLAMDAFSISTVVGFSIGANENMLTLKLRTILQEFSLIDLRL